MKVTGQTAETFVAETNLVFVALVGIEDPLRDSVPPAIEKSHETLKGKSSI